MNNTLFFQLLVFLKLFLKISFLKKRKSGAHSYQSQSRMTGTGAAPKALAFSQCQQVVWLLKDMLLKHTSVFYTLGQLYKDKITVTCILPCRVN